MATFNGVVELGKLFADKKITSKERDLLVAKKTSGKLNISQFNEEVKKLKEKAEIGAVELKPQAKTKKPAREMSKEPVSRDEFGNIGTDFKHETLKEGFAAERKNILGDILQENIKDISQGRTFDEAENLVARVLKEDLPQGELQDQSWWATNPNKFEAWTLLQNVMSSPNSLAYIVHKHGITDLQNKDWWNSKDFSQRDAIYKQVLEYNRTPPKTSPINPPVVDKRQLSGNQLKEYEQIQLSKANQIPDETGKPPAPARDSQITPPLKDTTQGQTAQPGVTTNTLDQHRADAFTFFDNEVAKGTVTPDEANFFKRVYDEIGVDDELNFDTLLSKFKKIQNETIDPYFAEQVQTFSRDLQDAVSFQTQQREAQLEEERSLAGENIRQVQGNLESRGLTFSGEAIKRLGDLSAFKRPEFAGQTGALVQQPLAPNAMAGLEGKTIIDTPFGGFFEGDVQQANRLIASSSAARFQQNLQSLGRQAENVLGTNTALRMNIPGFQSVGGVTGQLPAEQEQAKGQLFTQLAGQRGQNVAQDKPLEFNLPQSPLFR